MSRIKYLFAILITLFTYNSFADTKCFIAVEANRIISSIGNCIERHSPCSTFKIPLSVIGFNEGILQDETHPVWPYKQEYATNFELHKQSHNPTSWMQNSCVWYSQELTKKLGPDKFKEYVKKFKYGNQDVSGDAGKANGLTHSWLSSSLQISPVEQIDFLDDLIHSKLAASKKAQELTRKILYVEDLPGSWALYGKTGGGYVANSDGTLNQNKHIGWFIGWIEKGERKIIFAHYVEVDESKEFTSGKQAKAGAKEILQELLSVI